MPEDLDVPEGYRAGWIALLGPPNVGKSTLLNAMVGQKVAIVTSKPQTTRTQVTGILSRQDAQLVFFDTPGLHNRGGRMNRALLQAAWQALSGADVVVLVLDMAFAASRTHIFMDEIREFAETLLDSGRPLLVALNKVDIVKPKDVLLPIMQDLAELLPGATLFPISALRVEGLQPLIESMIEHLPESPPLFPPDQVSTAPMRFMAAELLREKLFEATRQEVPYSLAVDVEEWDEDPETGRVAISAVVFVARETHKRIVIGKNGGVLKEAATKTRHELMEMLGRKVHLEVWVKVKENWTENPAMLRQLGLG
ncbi:MAG: GTPase Era [Oceanidesulfovibrio sp.]